jgi:hypothetical protein
MRAIGRGSARTTILTFIRSSAADIRRNGGGIRLRFRLYGYGRLQQSRRGEGSEPSQTCSVLQLIRRFYGCGATRDDALALRTPVVETGFRPQGPDDWLKSQTRNRSGQSSWRVGGDLS